MTVNDEGDNDSQETEQLLAGPVPPLGAKVEPATAARDKWLVVKIILALFTLLLAFFLFRATRHSAPVEWSTCSEDSEFTCSKLLVPKDYFNSSAGFFSIAMARYSSRNRYVSARKGTIFLNPGGPGASGRDFAFRVAKDFSRVVGGGYDIVGFDPRGVGKSSFMTDCFPSILDYQVFKAGTRLELGFDVPRDPRSAISRAAIEVQFNDWLALTETQLRLCKQRLGEDIKYIGTTAVARDIDLLSRTLDGPQSPINYWGLSYGTVLGAYLVNMFPDRIGRVALDGVVNPVSGASSPPHTWLYDSLNGTELAYQWLLDACSSAGPATCALASVATDKSAAGIAQHIEEFLHHLYDNPMAVENAPRPGIITSGAARAVLYTATNKPRQFPEIAAAFATAMAGDGSPLFKIIRQPLDLSPHSLTPVRSIIPCLDAPPYDANTTDSWPTATDLTNEAIRVLTDVSPTFGMSVSLLEPDGGCEFLAHQGPAAERFTGPWNHALANPILIVNPSADPITPLASARLVNRLLGNSSRLAIQESPGHTSLFFGPSACIGRIYRDYFDAGRLPVDELRCKADVEIFPSSSRTEDEFSELVHRLGVALYEWAGIGLPI